MNGGSPKNVAASVRRRLQNLARDRQEDFQLLLTRYAIERLLYRVAQSPHRDRFVLKGALLFQLWSDQPYRPTRDIDFHTHGDHSVEHLTSLFREVSQQLVEDDGLRFLSETIVGGTIRQDQQYEGVRIEFIVLLERARIRLQVDIGFGDVIVPAPQMVSYPSLLGYPTGDISTYPKETVVAEKVQALVQLGIANSRMKDFFDLWTLTVRCDFDGALLARAIRATFERRRTAIPDTPPIALTDAFPNDRTKQQQWRAFVSRIGATNDPQFPQVIDRLRSFIAPMFDAIRTNAQFALQWSPGGPSWIPHSS